MMMMTMIAKCAHSDNNVTVMAISFNWYCYYNRFMTLSSRITSHRSLCCCRASCQTIEPSPVCFLLLFFVLLVFAVARSYRFPFSRPEHAIQIIIFAANYLFFASCLHIYFPPSSYSLISHSVDRQMEHFAWSMQCYTNKKKQFAIAPHTHTHVQMKRDMWWKSGKSRT